MFCRWCPWALVGVLALTFVAPGVSADSKKPKKVIPAVKFDASAERMNVFEGIEQGTLEVKMVPKDALGGNLFIENKGDKPVNVEFPAAFIGKQVLKQFGGGGLGGGGLGGGGGRGGGGAGGAGGGAQTQGGGLGGGGGGLGGGGFGGGGMGGGGGGGGFFSVPPERIVRVPYRSVCLEHGKPDPSPGMTYQIAKVEEFSEDPVLKEVLTQVANGQLEAQSAQAAAWHITDKMSWEQLAAKSIPHLGGRAPTPYFSAEQLHRAQQIFSTAVARVKEQTEDVKAATASTRTIHPSTSATVKRD
jgi:hypothetical protein